MAEETEPVLVFDENDEVTRIELILYRLHSERIQKLNQKKMGSLTPSVGGWKTELQIVLEGGPPSRISKQHLQYLEQRRAQEELDTYDKAEEEIEELQKFIGELNLCPVCRGTRRIPGVMSLEDDKNCPACCGYGTRTAYDKLQDYLGQIAGPAPEFPFPNQ